MAYLLVDVLLTVVVSLIVLVDELLLELHKGSTVDFYLEETKNESNFHFYGSISMENFLNLT